MLDIIRSTNTKAIDKLLTARSTTLAEAESVVRPILEDIRRHGNLALLRYSKKFDRLDLNKVGFTASRQEIRSAYREVPRDFVEAVRVAAENIRKAARKQLPQPWTCQTRPGVSISQIVRPLDALPATSLAAAFPCLPPY